MGLTAYPYRTRVLQHPHTHATREYTSDPFADRESACGQTGRTGTDVLHELPADAPVTCPACVAALASEES